jgi:sirohydrochlorin cobaltochelatase
VTEAVLLIAHGSRNPAAQADHGRLCELVGTAAGVTVRPAYLELAEPSIADAVDAAVADGADRVRLVPLFLHTGNHVARDIPGIVDAAREADPDVTIQLDEHVGADPGLVDLIAGRIQPPA